MKNILIGGTIRSGKSTLADMIRKEYNYSVIESDSIVNAFKKVFPELGIVHNKPKEARENYKPFLFEILNGFNKGLKYYGNVTVFPGSQFLPCQIYEYDAKENYIVIFLGINDTTPDLLLKKIRETETPNNWTYKETDEKLLSLCKNIIEESTELQSQCKKSGFHYFNTFTDREKTLKNIVKLIKDEQNNY